MERARADSLIAALCDGHFICLSEDGTLRLLRATPEKYDVVSEVLLEDPDAVNRPSALARLIYSNLRPGQHRFCHTDCYTYGAADRLVCLELIPAAKPAKN